MYCHALSFKNGSKGFEAEYFSAVDQNNTYNGHLFILFYIIFILSGIFKWSSYHHTFFDRGMSKLKKLYRNEFLNYFYGKVFDTAIYV